VHIIQLVSVVQLYVFLQIATSMLLYKSCCCPFLRHDISISIFFFGIIILLAFVVEIERDKLGMNIWVRVKTVAKDRDKWWQCFRD